MRRIARSVEAQQQQQQQPTSSSLLLHHNRRPPSTSYRYNDVDMERFPVSKYIIPMLTDVYFSIDRRTTTTSVVWSICVNWIDSIRPSISISRIEVAAASDMVDVHRARITRSIILTWLDVNRCHISNARRNATNARRSTVIIDVCILTLLAPIYLLTYIWFTMNDVTHLCAHIRIHFSASPSNETTQPTTTKKSAIAINKRELIRRWRSQDSGIASGGSR